MSPVTIAHARIPPPPPTEPPHTHYFPAACAAFLKNCFYEAELALSMLAGDAPLHTLTPGSCQVLQSATVAPLSSANGVTAD